MSQTSFNKRLFKFLKHSPTPFHASDTIAGRLQQNGFRLLSENEQWPEKMHGGYCCIRDDGSLLAWKTSDSNSPDTPWRMTVAHTDSPALQIKPLPETRTAAYTSLGVEVYGGPLLSTWFDRDLGIAGRVSLLTEKDTLCIRLLDFKRNLVTIPSLAIHLNRKANDGLKIDKQKQLLPILCQMDKELSFHDIIRRQLQKQYPDLAVKKILGFDLFCYDTQPPAFVGLNKEFITGSRLDNLVSCFVGMEALVQKNISGNCLLLCSNHEEIGSASVAGAHGNFLRSALQRIQPKLFREGPSLGASLLISMDNAHALHPNHAEKHDPGHTPLLNHGPVIKHNANQRYATTCRSTALYKIIAEEAGIFPQEFVMRSDMPCGSTIGPIGATDLGIQTIDVGVPSLAMHSIRETTGTKDPFLLFKTIARFYRRNSLPLVIQ